MHTTAPTGTPTTPVSALLMLTPERRLHGHPKWRQQLVVEIETRTPQYRATGHDR